MSPEKIYESNVINSLSSSLTSPRFCPSASKVTNPFSSLIKLLHRWLGALHTTGSTTFQKLGESEVSRA